jgi:hypothetical protein
MWRPEKLPVVMAHPHIFDISDESVACLRPVVPFAQAELPDNQNMASIVVSMKSAMGISLFDL